MELNVGMYVRTKYGIKQIYEINENKSKWKYLYKLKNQDEDGCTDLGVLCQEDIIKASYNIIDLIEEGDYVNGCLVVEHAYEKGRLFVSNIYIGGKGFTTIEDYSWELTKDREDNIKSIVTKEMYQSVEYRVETN